MSVCSVTYGRLRTSVEEPGGLHAWYGHFPKVSLAKPDMQNHNSCNFASVPYLSGSYATGQTCNAQRPCSVSPQLTQVKLPMSRWPMPQIGPCDRWILRTKGWRGKCFFLMTSSCGCRPNVLAYSQVLRPGQGDSEAAVSSDFVRIPIYNTLAVYVLIALIPDEALYRHFGLENRPDYSFKADHHTLMPW